MTLIVKIGFEARFNIALPAIIGDQMMVQEQVVGSELMVQKIIYSEYLKRDVIVDLYLPLRENSRKQPDLLLLNDGQDLRKIGFRNILASLTPGTDAASLVFAGIHCGVDRLNEYGTICTSDYKGRGSKAGLYAKFILDELLPFLQKQCNVSSFNQKSFAGFSLGGLSALDIVWNHPAEFSIAGVFSGSLWWRRRGYEEEGYDWDKDRIMHLQVQKGKHHPWLKFFFECGCLDETADRNNNGIIDSIEDTTDLIKNLKAIGYRDDQLRYLQLEDGEHNIETWARALPEFLNWGGEGRKSTVMTGPAKAGHFIMYLVSI